MTTSPRRAFLVDLAALTVALAGCKSGDDAGAPSAIAEADLLGPAEFLAARARGAAPPLFHVGPSVLFARGHVPEATAVGEAGEAAGLAALERAVASLPRETGVVVYCGCCPYRNCPNVRPALRKLSALGFAGARILDMPTNFKTDWVDRGFPVARS